MREDPICRQLPTYRAALDELRCVADALLHPPSLACAVNGGAAPSTFAGGCGPAKPESSGSDGNIIQEGMIHGIRGGYADRAESYASGERAAFCLMLQLQCVLQGDHARKPHLREMGNGPPLTLGDEEMRRVLDQLLFEPKCLSVGCPEAYELQELLRLLGQPLATKVARSTETAKASSRRVKPTSIGLPMGLPALLHAGCALGSSGGTTAAKRQGAGPVMGGAVGAMEMVAFGSVGELAVFQQHGACY